VQRRDFFRYLPAGDRSHLCRQRKRLASGVDHVEAIEPEVVQRDVHRPRHGRRGRPLELEAETPRAVHDEEVELGALMSRPEVAILPPTSSRATT